ncbi:hypothetical protein EOPP23_00305 [Endozoicomonas sp. OPT23]|nr:hypothetical protein [Endozoicomonas sp. OPT23]
MCVIPVCFYFYPEHFFLTRGDEKVLISLTADLLYLCRVEVTQSLQLKPNKSVREAGLKFNR